MRISWVCTNRDDGYNGKLIDIIRKSLALNSISALESGIELKIVFFDYGSNIRFLSSLLQLQKIHRMFTFVALDLEKSRAFNVPQVLNHAVPKCRDSDIILVGSIDQFFTTQSLANFRNLSLRGDVKAPLIYGSVPRRVVESSFAHSFYVLSDTSVHEIFNNHPSSAVMFTNQKVNISAGVGMLLFNIRTFQEIGPFKSIEGHGYCDVDYGLRFSENRAMYDFSNFGIYINKFPRLSTSLRQRVVSQSRKPNQYYMSRDLSYESVTELDISKFEPDYSENINNFKSPPLLAPSAAILPRRKEVILLISMMVRLKLRSVYRACAAFRLLNFTICETWLPIGIKSEILKIMIGRTRYSPIVFYSVLGITENTFETYVNLSQVLYSNGHESSVSLLDAEKSYNYTPIHDLRKLIFFDKKSQTEEVLNCFLSKTCPSEYTLSPI
jgi:hypothetical protein